MTLRERAAGLLRKAADGKALSREEVHALAWGWLEVTGGNVALAVLDGGGFEVARTIEFCGRIIDWCADVDGAVTDAKRTPPC